MRLFYGFHYRDGRSTTTGDPHPITGRMSIAGKLKVFATREARDEWVDVDTSNPYLGFREAVNTKKQARELCLGWSVADFHDYIRQEAILLEGETE